MTDEELIQLALKRIRTLSIAGAAAGLAATAITRLSR